MPDKLEGVDVTFADDRDYNDVKIKNTPHSSKMSVIHIESIYDDDIIKRNKEEVTKNFDGLLKAFGNGAEATEEDKNVINFFNNGTVSGTRLAYVIGEKLTPYGLGSEVPTVQEMLEVGNNIMIKGDDGKHTTFTEKYFLNNKNVQELAEKEFANDQNKGYGSAMAAFLYAYLAEYNNKDLKNFDNTFNSKVDKVPAYFADKKGNIHAIVDKESHLEYNKEIDKQINQNKEATDKYKAEKKILDDITKEKEAASAEQIEALDEHSKAFDVHENAKKDFNNKYAQEITMPQKPVEKSRWRRFFHAIGLAPHSRDYINRMNDYNTKLETYRQYQIDKEALAEKANTLKMAENKLVSSIEKVADIDKSIMNQEIKMKEIGKTIGNPERDDIKSFVDNEKANYAGMAANLIDFPKQYFRERNAHKATDIVNTAWKDKDALGTIESSNLIDFKEGGLNLMMKSFNERKTAKVFLRSEIMAANATDIFDKHKKEIEKLNVDDKQKKKIMNVKLDQEYQLQTMKAAKLFERTFSLKPTPVNVQAVMDAMGFQNQVEFRLKNVDKAKLDDTNKLPTVNAKNVDDMTLALMAGIKTAIKDGMLKAKTGEMEYSYPLANHKVNKAPVKETNIVTLNKKINGEKEASSKGKHSDVTKALPAGEKVIEGKQNMM